MDSYKIQQPSQEQVSEVMREICHFVNRTEDKLGDMSRSQKVEMCGRMIAFWISTEDICHHKGGGRDEAKRRMSEFMDEFGPFIDGYISQEFNDEELAS